MKLVIVDDVEINVALLKHLAKRLPECEAVGFTDPAAALAWCRDTDPDLVITDCAMPGMDGGELTRRIRALPGRGDVPVLMVVAAGEHEARYAALEAGVTDFLAKPVDKTEFVARVRALVELRSSRKALADQAPWVAREVAKAAAAIEEREYEAICCLARTAESRDGESGAHVQRIGLYARHIAANLGLSHEEQRLVEAGAALHDLGKLEVPETILLKPGRLSESEMAVVRNHAEAGWFMLRGYRSAVLQSGALIAYTHHEKFDGTGYPRKLAGEQIPLPGRIVAVADVFDALTSERPFKRAWDLARAAEHIRSARGAHFDPACVDAFFRDWEKVTDVYNRLRERVNIPAVAGLEHHR